MEVEKGDEVSGFEAARSRYRIELHQDLQKRAVRTRQDVGIADSHDARSDVSSAT